MSRSRVPRHPDGGFTSIRYPEQLVPCALEPAPFDDAQVQLERKAWLAHLSAIETICDYCVDCPIAQQCGAAAVAERYSGIAGGRIWKNGQDVSERVAA